MWSNNGSWEYEEKEFYFWYPLWDITIVLAGALDQQEIPAAVEIIIPHIILFISSMLFERKELMATMDQLFFLSA